MPMYDYRCDVCGKEETVIASITQADTLPTETSSTDCISHTWVKVFKGAPTLYRGRNWGPGSKGNW